MAKVLGDGWGSPEEAVGLQCRFLMREEGWGLACSGGNGPGPTPLDPESSTPPEDSRAQLSPNRAGCGAGEGTTGSDFRGPRTLRTLSGACKVLRCPASPQLLSLVLVSAARFTVHKSHVFPPCVAAFTTRTSSRAACLVYFMFRKQQIPPPFPSYSQGSPSPQSSYPKFANFFCAFPLP